MDLPLLKGRSGPSNCALCVWLESPVDLLKRKPNVNHCFWASKSCFWGPFQVPRPSEDWYMEQGNQEKANQREQNAGSPLFMAFAFREPLSQGPKRHPCCRTWLHGDLSRPKSAVLGRASADRLPRTQGPKPNAPGENPTNWSPIKPNGAAS